MSAGQAEHEVAPVAEIDPLAQGMHAEPSVLKVPGLHCWQEPLTRALPGEHLVGTHDVCPVRPRVVLPFPQGRHCWHWLSYVSTGHAEHLEEPC